MASIYETCLDALLDAGYDFEYAEQEAYFTFLECIGEAETMENYRFGGSTELTMPDVVDLTPPDGWERVVEYTH